MEKPIILNFVQNHQWCETFSDVGVVDIPEADKHGFENILFLKNVGYLWQFIGRVMKGMVDGKIRGIVLPENFYGKSYIRKMLYPSKIEVMSPARVEFLFIKEQLKERKNGSNVQ